MNPRILIADDEPEIRAMLKSRFEMCDYEVITAENGEECVEKTLQYHPKMIIMDVIMPVMTGADAVRRLKLLSETKNIPILLLTALAGYLSENDNERCINIDGQLFPALGKPFDSKELVLAASKLMSESAGDAQSNR